MSTTPPPPPAPAPGSNPQKPFQPTSTWTQTSKGVKISLGMDPTLQSTGSIGKLASSKAQSGKISVTVQGDNIAVVTILESRILDESNINEIGFQLLQLVTQKYMVKMVLDLNEVKYLSSAVLRQFISLYKTIKQEKGELVICRIRPEVREVFKITQLDKMITIKEDLASAIKCFDKSSWGFLKR
jgi:anti-sigma B factor antagonist